MATNPEHGSDRNRDTSSHGNRSRSPLHPQLQQTKTASRTGSGSPALEKKMSAEGISNPGTPGRVRARAGNSSSRSIEQAERSSVPKFGAWDANDPSSGDGFTIIFNKARDEKKSTGSARTGLHSDSAAKYSEESKDPLTYQRSSSSKWCGCFGSTSGEI